MLHFWAAEIDEEIARATSSGRFISPNPVATLQAAFEHTTEATQKHDWQGTTTACGAQLHYRQNPNSNIHKPTPLLYVTNLGDCQVMVLRPSSNTVIFKTKEQWHWFDCPRQLGTNSPDTPKENAVMDEIDLEVGDVVLAMSDGVIDNLWEHEIAETVLGSLGNYNHERVVPPDGMQAVAQDLVTAAKQVALDPFAESPYMEHAIDEGLASEGGKWRSTVLVPSPTEE